MATSHEPTRTAPPAGRLGGRIIAAYVLLGGFFLTSVVVGVFVYLSLQIDSFCGFDPDEPQCIDPSPGPSWPNIVRFALWIAAGLACLTAFVFAHRVDTYPRERRHFVVSVAAAVVLIAATAVAAYPLIAMA